MYTSGRTKKYTATSSVQRATKEARQLASRLLPGVAGVTVRTQGTADPASLASQTRTEIGFPESADSSDLALAVEGMPGYVRSTWTCYGITIIREA